MFVVILVLVLTVSWRSAILVFTFSKILLASLVLKGLFEDICSMFERDLETTTGFETDFETGVDTLCETLGVMENFQFSFWA